MLDGWYCRSMANEQAAHQDETTDHSISDGEDAPAQTNKTSAKSATDYKEQYRYLKRKFKFLIYENEFFQDALRSNQRRLLKVSRDRAFLLDRLLQYERPDITSSESDETDSSDDEAMKEAKKRKLEKTNTNGGQSTRGRKKKVNTAEQSATATNTSTPTSSQTGKDEQQSKNEQDEHQPGHMTPAEVERHLQARQPILELMPERTPATVPAEMFSNEPSLDSESNEHHMMDGSPTHVAAEECVPMEYCN